MTAQAADSAPLLTSRSQFAIPYRYDQHELKRLQAQFVHLYQSRNRGQSWQHVQTADLQQSGFLFHPAQDGEYWFSVAISDAQDRLHPDPRTSPAGLKVIVDRQAPELTLNIQQVNASQVELSWKMADAHLAVETLTLQYRNSSQENWKPVLVTPQNQGKTAWRIQPGQRPQVRGTVQDQAGNQQQAAVVLAGGAAPQLTYDPLNSEKQPVSSGRALSERGPTGIAHQVPLQVSESEMPLIMPAVSQQPAQNSSPQTISSAELPASQVSFPRLALPEQASSTPVEDIHTDGQELQRTQRASGPMMSPAAAPAVAQPPQSTSAPVRTVVPASVRFLNTREFHIDYQVTGVGPSGVGVVELFITQDGGAQWWRYGVDPDLTSPMTVKVPEDGLYGFHFRIHSGVGNSEPPPQPGQTPQIQVMVDTMPPQVELLTFYQGHGAELNQLTVQWDFLDDHPSERPISLFYGGSLSGPWQQIESNLRSNGSHTFPLPANAPTRLYVRVMATDAAGNRAEAISKEPLLIDLSRPTARVITIDAIR